MSIHTPRLSSATIAASCRGHLEAAVRIDSQSDENSDAIPSSPGQALLGDACAAILARHGARIERDEHANLVATLQPAHVPPGTPPLALLVHLDTARGTRALHAPLLVEKWDGCPIPYPERPELVVDTGEYPETAPFLGHDLLHGPGDAPFGLDDKLGLAQLLTLSELLADDSRIARPPLMIVARPDEEIGRMEAVTGLADLLAARGVREGFTIDGILPHEVNVENFNAAGASVLFPGTREQRPSAQDTNRIARVVLGGVNTHGATARAEGHRAATRLAAEIVALLDADGLVPASLYPVAFASDAARDCDATVTFLLGQPKDDRADRAWPALCAAVREVVSSHVPRGASFHVHDPETVQDRAVHGGTATLDMLRFVGRLLASAPGFKIAAEDSSGHEGYTAPYRAGPADGGIRLDLRLRDFRPEGLDRRKAHLRALVAGLPGARVEIHDQYVNMGPRLAERPELVRWAQDAAVLTGARSRVAPIRGGTGVDPFLERGIAIANLGTGYFAPESEKEFTSLQMMESHVRWLFALVQVVARSHAGS